MTIVVWDPDRSGHASGTAWATELFGEAIGFVVFFDFDRDDFDFASDVVFQDERSRERFRRRLIDEISQQAPMALVRSES